MGLVSSGWVVPILLAILTLSALIAAGAVLSDALAWFARARRREAPGVSGLFRVWPLPMWALSAALLPDLAWRIAAGAMALEHAARLFAESSRRAGRVIAGESKENAPAP